MLQQLFEKGGLKKKILVFFFILVFLVLFLVILFILNESFTGKATDSGIVRIRLPGENENITNETNVAVPSGGGKKILCEPEWRCYNKVACKNLFESNKSGLVDSSFYNLVNSSCELLGLDIQNCGYKIWECFDLNECNDNSTKPEPYEVCTYPEEESCFDSIKNQGEEGIDCGGPCEFCVEYPLESTGELRLIYNSLPINKIYLYSLLFFVLILILFIILVYRLSLIKRKLEEVKLKKVVKKSKKKN